MYMKAGCSLRLVSIVEVPEQDEVPTLPDISVVKSSLHGLSIFITPDQLTLASTSTH